MSPVVGCGSPVAGRSWKDVPSVRNWKESEITEDDDDYVLFCVLRITFE